jgi:hypothetical protein
MIEAGIGFLEDEGCDRLGEPTYKPAIPMDMKSNRNSLGCNPLSDTPYWNSCVVLNVDTCFCSVLSLAYHNLLPTRGFVVVVTSGLFTDSKTHR